MFMICHALLHVNAIGNCVHFCKYVSEYITGTFMHVFVSVHVLTFTGHMEGWSKSCCRCKSGDLQTPRGRWQMTPESDPSPQYKDS